MPSQVNSAWRALSVALRVFASLLILGTVLLLVPAPALRQVQIELSLAVQAVEPQAIRGALVFVTGMGTALRGDFLVSAAALLLIDWLVGRLAGDAQGR